MQCPNDGALLNEVRNPLTHAYFCSECKVVYPVNDPRLAPTSLEQGVCRLCGNANDEEFMDHHACHSCRVAELTGIITVALTHFANAAALANDHELGHGVDELNAGVESLGKVNEHE